jgi:hypothetical protein
MQLACGLCFSYSAANAGAGHPEAPKFARLESRNVDGTWLASPLLPVAQVDVALLPVDPEEAALRLVDSAVRQIPEMVGDARLGSQLSMDIGPGISFRPVLVANEQAFRDFLALHREGMEDVYRIALQFTDAAAGPGELHST